MKKRIIIFGTLTICATILAFLSSWAYAESQRKQLYGVFDIGMNCMGGHEIFLDLDSVDAFDNCPGHRERKRIGRIIRTNDSVVVIDPRDDAPWFRIDWNGSEHSLSFLKPPDSQSLMGMIPVRGSIKQVTNPSRLWIPRLLPEE